MKKQSDGTLDPYDVDFIKKLLTTVEQLQKQIDILNNKVNNLKQQ